MAASALALAVAPAAGAQTLSSTATTWESDASFSTDLTDDEDLLTTNISFEEATAGAVESADTSRIPVVASEDSAVFPVNVTYNVTGGSADEGDYAGGDGTMTFTEAGQVRNVTLDLADDDVAERDETVDLTLSSDNPFVVFGTANHTHVIVDDDPVNEPPETSAVSLTTETGTTLSGTLQATDPDGDALMWSVDVHPHRGTLDLDADTGDYVYRPDEGFVGEDVFDVRVSDGDASDTAQVTVTVTEAGDGTTGSTDGGSTDDGSTDGTSSSDDGDTDTSGTTSNTTSNATSSTGASGDAGSAGDGSDDGGAGLDGDGFPIWGLLAGVVLVIGLSGAAAYGFHTNRFSGL